MQRAYHGPLFDRDLQQLDPASLKVAQITGPPAQRRNQRCYARMAQLMISRPALEEVEGAQSRYQELLDERLSLGSLTRSSRDTYFNHAREFVRWLRDDFDPAAQKLR